MNPKVSILVPIYGVEKFIERCAISLFDQNFESIEYIFINDCTKDRSVEVLKKVANNYPHKNIKIFNNEINLGIAGTRELAINKAEGDYILFVDSDDYIEKEMIEALYKKAEEDNADIVVCDYFIQWTKNGKVSFKQNISKLKEEFTKELLSLNVMSAFWNKLIRKELFDRKGVEFVKGVNLGEDYMTMPKLSFYADKVSSVHLPLYVYSQENELSYTTQKLSTQSINNMIYILDNLESFFCSKDSYYLYERALVKGRVKKLLDFCFLADSRDLSILINVLLQTKKFEDVSSLIQRDRISYFLLSRKMIFLYRMYRKIYVFLYLIKNKIK